MFDNCCFDWLRKSQGAKQEIIVWRAVISNKEFDEVHLLQPAWPGREKATNTPTNAHNNKQNESRVLWMVGWLDGWLIHNLVGWLVGSGITKHNEITRSWRLFVLTGTAYRRSQNIKRAVALTGEPGVTYSQSHSLDHLCTPWTWPADQGQEPERSWYGGAIDTVEPAVQRIAARAAHRRNRWRNGPSDFSPAAVVPDSIPGTSLRYLRFVVLAVIAKKNQERFKLLSLAGTVILVSALTTDEIETLGRI